MGDMAAPSAGHNENAMSVKPQFGRALSSTDLSLNTLSNPKLLCG